MDKLSALERKLAREKAARQQAEQLLESKSLELYQANQQLELVLNQLKLQTRNDLHKIEFEQHVNEALIHFGRAFLRRSFDDGMIASLLERLEALAAISAASLTLEPGLIASVDAHHFGQSEPQDLSLVKAYPVWEDGHLVLPIEVERRVVGQLTITVEDNEIERDFVVNQMLLVAELMCSAISRQLILISNQQARARAEESERATQEFVAMINHELRTPLNGLLGSAELLADSQLDEQQQVLLSNLTHSGDLLRHIINDLLDFSKMNAGMMELIPAKFHWPDLREMLIGIFDNRAREKGIVFEINQLGDIPGAMIGDFERIGQILVNLVGNAVKFTLQGKVTLTVGYKGTTLHFVVKDTGIGISEQAQRELFNPFVQADRTAKRNFEGTGLGLAICKNLVELMSGSISFRSELGKGSCFEVILPVEIAVEEPSVDAVGPSHKRDKPFDQLAILVVDDIRMNQVIINQMLKKLLIVPDIANNGLEAIDAVSSGDYDLIFMDCRMPEMDGFEATQRLRKQGCQLPIIALTAGTTLSERERCIESGMDDILTKPYTAKDLTLILEKWTR
ncbi:ATP-binding protein [Vibrio sinaloensis]|uniref:ATP-binding protein n=1 Tax=Photobacterium sp. (strain ATCC 43367) TaxID=379097 RepID=UPI00205037E7|nr:ATP-binding protein [Vibrio sinaloensis]UPQ89015.1 ATP-binding protein [Vibrio sinaloensis]